MRNKRCSHADPNSQFMKNLADIAARDLLQLYQMNVDYVDPLVPLERRDYRVRSCCAFPFSDAPQLAPLKLI